MKVRETDSVAIDYSKLQPEKDISTLEEEMAILRWNRKKTTTNIYPF